MQSAQADQFMANKPLAGLSRMMIDCAGEALRNDDYVNALEYVFALSAVDDHPDATIALAVTALEVINALELADKALRTKVKMLRWLANSSDNDKYDRLRKTFDEESLSCLLFLARGFSAGNLMVLGDLDEILGQLVQEINSISSEGMKSSATTLAEIGSIETRAGRDLIVQHHAEYFQAEL